MDARPWLWLTETIGDPNEKREYLEQALAAEPSSIAARRGLAALTGKLDESTTLAPGEGVKVQKSGEPPEAQSQGDIFMPKMWGQMEFNIQTNVVP